MLSADINQINDEILSVIAVFLQLVSGIRIKNLRVPEVARYGRPVLLDCEYSVDDEEEGLVVKWHFNGSIVYQWIPKVNNPTASGPCQPYIVLESPF